LNYNFLRYFIHEDIFFIASEFQAETPTVPEKMAVPEISKTQSSSETEEYWSKKLLVLTDDFRGKKIPTVERELLLKIFKAIHINPRMEVDVIPIENFMKDQIRNPQTILILAENLPDDFQFPKYEVADFRGIPVISANSLNEMFKNTSQKRQLWHELKRVFSI